MKITWVRQVKPVKKDKNEKAAATEEEKKKQTASQSQLETATQKQENEEDQKFVFTVIPETVVLNPKMGIMVEFRANSS